MLRSSHAMFGYLFHAELQFFSHVDVQSRHHRIETRMRTNTARDLSKHRNSASPNDPGQNITHFYHWAKSRILEDQTPRNEATTVDLREPQTQLSSCTTNDAFVEGYLSSSHPPLYHNSILETKTCVKGCSTVKHQCRHRIKVEGTTPKRGEVQDLFKPTHRSCAICCILSCMSSMAMFFIFFRGTIGMLAYFSCLRTPGQLKTIEHRQHWSLSIRSANWPYQH